MRPTYHISKLCQRGLSLVELMVALLLGVVLSFGAVNLFMASKISFLQDEQSARMQEGGRFALRYTTRELAMAGFYGGILRGEFIDSNLDSGTSDCYDWLTDTEYTLEHRDNVDSAGATASSTLPGDCLASGVTIVPGTDILVIRRVNDSPAYLRDKDDLVIQAFDKYDDKADYLRVEDYNVSTTLEHLPASRMDLITASGPMAMWQYTPQLIFVTSDVTGVPALCRRGISDKGMADTTCLVEGVENLQVEFGIDSDDDYVPDRYFSDPTAAQLSFALNARIYLLVRSTNQLGGYTNDKAYTLGGENVAAKNDSYYRRVYQSSTMLKNSEALGI